MMGQFFLHMFLIFGPVFGKNPSTSKQMFYTALCAVVTSTINSKNHLVAKKSSAETSTPSSTSCNLCEVTKNRVCSWKVYTSSVIFSVVVQRITGAFFELTAETECRLSLYVLNGSCNGETCFVILSAIIFLLFQRPAHSHNFTIFSTLHIS